MAKVPVLKLINCETFEKRSNLIANGMPLKVVEALLQRKVLVQEDLSKISPTRTYARRKLEGVLSKHETDKVLRVAELFDRAVDVFGNEEKAFRWLRSPCRALDGKVPVELAFTSTGAAEVERELGRIDYGIIS